jgi:hypothetical protein
MEGSQVSPVCPLGKGSTQITMIRDHWWIRTDKEKSKYSEKILSQCHHLHHKSCTSATIYTTNPVPVPPFTPQISQVLAWDRNGASAVAGQSHGTAKEK